MKVLSRIGMWSFYFSFFMRAFPIMYEPGFHDYTGLDPFGTIFPFILILLVLYYLMFKLASKNYIYPYFVQIAISSVLITGDILYYPSKEDYKFMVFTPCLYILYGALILSLLISVLNIFIRIIGRLRRNRSNLCKD